MLAPVQILLHETPLVNIPRFRNVENGHRFPVPPSESVSAGSESGEPLARTHRGSIWPVLVLDRIRQLALRGCVHPLPAEHHRQTPSCASAASL